MRPILKWSIALLALLVALPLKAQEPPPIDAFAYLFPHPTGTNGYEEWVKAGALVSRNEFANRVTKDSRAPLSDIRKLLKETDIQMARTLFYAGMEKPATDPRTEMELDTLIPEFSLFRAYARLHAKEIVLYLADGKNAEAIKALRTGLQFGRLVQQKTLISGLVGIAIDALVLKPFDGALEKFSAKDCDALLSVVKEWLQDKSPAADVLSADERWVRHVLQKFKDKPSSLFAALSERGVPDDTIRSFQGNGVDIGATLAQADRKVDAYYQSMLEGLKVPAYQRKPISGISEETLGGKIASLYCPTLKHFGDTYDKIRSRVQTLGVRLYLRKYYLERRRFPESLSDLSLGALALDPFTGKPFEYQREGALYALKFRDPKFND